MKAIAKSTIKKINNIAINQAGSYPGAAHNQGLTLVKRQGGEFDGVSLWRNSRGGHCTLWEGSDYIECGFDDNLDIWEGGE